MLQIQTERSKNENFVNSDQSLECICINCAPSNKPISYSFPKDTVANVFASTVPLSTSQSLTVFRKIPLRYTYNTNARNLETLSLMHYNKSSDTTFDLKYVCTTQSAICSFGISLKSPIKQKMKLKSKRKLNILFKIYWHQFSELENRLSQEFDKPKKNFRC